MGIQNVIANIIAKFLIKHYSDVEETNVWLIGILASKYFDPARFSQTFHVWQNREVHITPVHYDYPIPDTRTLSEQIWTKQSKLTGINLNEQTQIELLTKYFPRFREEYNQFQVSSEKPEGFHFKNGVFDGIDALTLYCMLRHYKPKTIIEVGSGFSTRLSADAIRKNGTGKLICIEPYPDEILKKGFDGISTLISKKVETLDSSFVRRFGCK